MRALDRLPVPASPAPMMGHEVGAARTEPLPAVQALTAWSLSKAGTFETPSGVWRGVVSPVYRFLNGSVSADQARASFSDLSVSEILPVFSLIERTHLEPPDVAHFTSAIERYWLGRGWYPLCGELAEYFMFADNTPVETPRFHLAVERTKWAVSGSLYREALAFYCRGLALTAHLRKLGLHLEPSGGLPVDNQALCETIGELGARILLWEKAHGEKTAAPGVNSEDPKAPINLILRWGLAVMLDLSVHDTRRSIFDGTPEFTALWPHGHESSIPFYAELAISELTQSLLDAQLGGERDARRLISEVLLMNWEKNGFRSPFLLNNSFTEFDVKTHEQAMTTRRPTRERAFTYALPICCSELGCQDRMPEQRHVDETIGFQRRFLL